MLTTALPLCCTPWALREERSSAHEECFLFLLKITSGRHAVGRACWTGWAATTAGLPGMWHRACKEVGDYPDCRRQRVHRTLCPLAQRRALISSFCPMWVRVTARSMLSPSWLPSFTGGASKSAPEREETRGSLPGLWAPCLVPDRRDRPWKFPRKHLQNGGCGGGQGLPCLDLKLGNLKFVTIFLKGV